MWRILLSLCFLMFAYGHSVKRWQVSSFTPRPIARSRPKPYEEIYSDEIEDNFRTFNDGTWADNDIFSRPNTKYPRFGKGYRKAALERPNGYLNGFERSRPDYHYRNQLMSPKIDRGGRSGSKIYPAIRQAQGESPKEIVWDLLTSNLETDWQTMSDLLTFDSSLKWDKKKDKLMIGLRRLKKVLDKNHRDLKGLESNATPDEAS